MSNVILINNPSETKSEMRSVISSIISSIEALNIEGFEIRVALVEGNKITIDVDPVNMSSNVMEFLKFIDRVVAQCVSGPMMTSEYFNSYFCVLFRHKYVKAYPDDYVPGKLTIDDINEIFRTKGMPFIVCTHTRDTDPNHEEFYTLLEEVKK